MKIFAPAFLLLMLTSVCTVEQSINDDPAFSPEQLIEDLRILSSDEMNGRLVGSEGNRMAREYIIERMKQEGIMAFEGDYEHPFTTTRRNGETINGVNVLGLIPGKTDSTLVISAHYDHIGHRDSLIFNGADDNASGTAGLLAIGSHFVKHQPRHSLILAFFDAEEGGLNGARAFVEDSLRLALVKMNINMDMIAQNQDNELYAVGTYHYPYLKSVLMPDASMEAGSDYEVDLLFGHDDPDAGVQDWTYASDHGPFHRSGIPFIYFGVEDHPHYHKATDEFETIPQDFYLRSVKSILTAVERLDSGI